MIDLKAAPFYLKDNDLRWVEETISSMTMEEKVGQLFCPIGVCYDEEYLLDLTKRLRVGGLLFRAGPSAEIQKAHRFLQENSTIPLLLAANVETGGDGIAEDGTGVGEQMNIAAAGDVELAYAHGRVAAREGAAVGLNWAFGPIVDIDLNYRNPITNVRTFGSAPETVRRMGLAVHRGLTENGLASCAKHFPGDGVDDRDQHLLTSVNSLSREEWDNTYGEIYRNMIDADVLSVMAGHIRLPAYQTDELPATLSKELLQGLLRKKLGFNGLVITDATPMVGFCAAMERRRAVPYAIEAGCDMFLFNKDVEEDFQYMREGIENGILSEKRLHEALTRILGMKAAMGLHRKKELVPGDEMLAVVACEEHRAIARACADRSVTLVRDKAGHLPISPEKHRRVLLEVLGGFPSGERIRGKLEERLTGEGFRVTHYIPETFETLDCSVERFRENYDLVLYIGNIENVSNKTVGRIEWHTFFGNGNNTPWFVHEVPTVFVGVGNPYLLQDVPMIPTFVNAYFNSDLYLDAVVDKLLGRSAFRGTSPVDPFCGRDDL